MNLFSKNTPIKEQKIPDPPLNYRPKLENLPAFSQASAVTPVDIAALTEGVPLSLKPDFIEEIYAILPVNNHFQVTSCIVYRETILLVEGSPFQIVLNLLDAIEHLDYYVYRLTLNHLLQSKTRLTPIATRFYSLFPTGGISLNSTMWINPGRVIELNDFQNQSILRLENLFTVSLKRRATPIQKSMKKAFLAHAIIKREHETGAIQPTISLLEFLNITSSNETRTILKNLEYQHTPNYKNEFFKQYFNYNNKRIEAKAIKDYCEKYGIAE